MVDDNPMLDALLDALEEGVSDSDEDVAVPPPVIHQNTISPSLVRYLRSSSAKRRKRKDGNCNFCIAQCGRENLEGHLANSRKCLELYQRKHHVKTLLAVMVMEFQCLFCDSDVPQFRNHLNCHPPCLASYKEKLQVNSVDDVVSKVLALKKAAQPSRRALKRSLENADQRSKKKSKLDAEPAEHFVNQHLQETSYVNYKTCFGCKASINNALEITKDSPCIVKGLYALEDYSEWKRFEKYFLCKHCSERTMNIPNFQDTTLDLDFVESEPDKITFFLSHLRCQDQDIETAQMRDKTVTVMSPTSFESCENLQTNLRSLTQFEIQHLLYGRGALDKMKLSRIVEDQLGKYKKRLTFGDCFLGTIQDLEQKKLNSVRTNYSDNKLRGSKKWREAVDNDVHWKMITLGKSCLYIEMDVPFDTPIFASLLLQHGISVSVSMEGEACYSMKRRYYVHDQHHAEDDCPGQECHKVELLEYMRRNNIGLNLNLHTVSTYIAFADQQLNSVIKNLLNAHTELQAEDYHIEAKFNLDGTISFVGLVWTSFGKKINMIGLETFNGDEIKDIKQDYLNSIDRLITTGSKKNSIKDQLNVSDSVGREIEQLVDQKQHHICPDLSHCCEKCQIVSIPNVETTFTSSPSEENYSNVLTSKKFVAALKEQMFSMSIDDLEEISTIAWIEQVQDCFEVNEIQEPNIWRLQLYGEDFMFRIDDRMADLIQKYEQSPLVGLCTYAVSCVSSGDQHRILLKNSQVKDCFTEPYVRILLEANRSRVKVLPLSTLSEWKSITFKPSPPINLPGENLNSFKEISLTESLVLLDSTRLNIKTSRATEFLYTAPTKDQTVLLKKVVKETEDTFTMDGDKNFYEVQYSQVSKFFKRLNGKEILLIEVASYYESLEKKKAEPLYDFYKDRLNAIETSGFKSAISDEFLPSLILSGNKQVLRIRGKPKVVKTMDFNINSFDFKYSQVLLYYRLRSEDQMSQEFVSQAFLEEDHTGNKTIVNNRRKYLLQLRKHI